MIAGSRLHKKGERFTALFKMSKKSFKPFLTFPSGKDTSSPGMVYRNKTLYVSYYSSHEGKSAIYFAKISGIL
jgi:hypothetical protein